MRRALLVVCSCVRVASAEPADSSYAVQVATGAAFAPLAADDVFGRLELTGSWRWRERLVVGAALAVDVNRTSDLGAPSGATFYKGLVELGAWLQPSQRVGTLLGWRVGRAWLDFGFASMQATVFEPVAELAFRLNCAVELRFEPVAFDFYRTTTWQMTIGTNVGVAWRL